MKRVNLFINRSEIDDEAAATAVEYALLVALIAVVIGAGVAAFGSSLNTFFTNLFATLSL